MINQRWRALFLLAAAAILAACSDSRSEPLLSPESSGDAGAVLVGDLPERPNKWGHMPDAELREAVEKAGGRVIIGVKEPGTPRGVYRGRVFTSAGRRESAKGELSALGARIVREYHLSPAVVAEIDPAKVGVIRRLPWIDYLEPDLPGKWMSQDTTWNVWMVGAPTAWTRVDGDGVDVLIIDSGIWSDNTDLNPASVHDCADGEGLDEVGHGSFVAGIVAARDNVNYGVIGGSPGVDLRIVRVGTQRPFPSTVACAIEYGRDNDYMIMNMSLALVDSSEVVQDEIEAAWDEGHLLVAAGGDSTDAAVVFPASLDEVIAVIPVKQDSSFWGPEDDEVELAAPGGTGITSTGSIYGIPPWNDTIVTDEGIGSSYASPHVAAAAALLWDLHPSWTNEEIRDTLKATAYDLGDSGWDDRYGYGLVDIPAALGITPFSSLSISGPDEIQPEDENCIWEAVVSGGSEPITFTWLYDGYWVSSGSSWTGGLNPLDEDEEFVLTLWLTDYWYHSISDTLLVTTSEQARWCTFK